MNSKHHMPLKVAPCALTLTINHFIPDPSGKTQKKQKMDNWTKNQMENCS